MEPIRYMTSLLTFYLKGEIRQEQNFVNLKKPNTILGVIPLGAKKDSIPVTQLASVESDFSLRIKRLIIGLVVAILGVSIISDIFILGLICLVLGVNYILTAFETYLTIRTTAGETKLVSFLIFEKGKAEQAETQIRSIISMRLDDTNNRRQTDRIVDAINRK
ncbi:MAG: hypothetical protein IJY12_04565 [Clostridia bacterium]|nr:hypothetical protein [Clostridia bacterium]